MEDEPLVSTVVSAGISLGRQIVSLFANPLYHPRTPPHENCLRRKRGVALAEEFLYRANAIEGLGAVIGPRWITGCAAPHGQLKGGTMWS